MLFDVTLGSSLLEVPEQILVIEDEPGIVDFLERGLSAQGFQVLSALDGDGGLDRALTEEVDLVVLDMLLPGRGGLEVLERLRQAKPALPVIVLTALGEVDDRVSGLDAGATDYLTKPFSLTELAARIRAQLRIASQVPQTSLISGGIEVELLTREVRRDGDPIRLSTTEFELLVYLMRNRGHVLTREQILRAVWGYEHDPGTNVVDVYVGYLRRKLRSRDDDVPITTIRSVGYRFDAEG
ncbi:MAG: response regulator transcription factor [Solirubrobacterales bacterium]|nr:response regulator transcription factor [Solirubrobacterales bacterium]